MSIALMSAAFAAPINATQKLVLLALCDCANDHGECYPSVQKLLEKTSLKERAVQAAMAALEAAGYMRREFRNGRSTVYWMTPQPPHQTHPRTKCTPAPNAPAPARHAPPPPHQMHHTPAPHAPITVTESSVEPSGNQKRKDAPPSVAPAVLVEAGFCPEVAAEFIAHKSRMKAPLTARAWADHVREAQKAGWSAVEAAEKVMAKSWKGFEAKYVANERPGGGPISKQAALEARNRAVLDEIFAGAR